jgi:K+-sensing histidine kinase KdpD
MRLLLWGGYLNICIICLVGTWIWRSSRTHIFEAIVVTVLIVSIINVACLTERRHAIGFYLWLFSTILFAFSTLLRLWFTFVQEYPVNNPDSED